VTDRDEACLVCGSKQLRPLYESPHAISLTSALLLATTTTFVSACGSCGHVQTRPIEAITQYYDAAYNFQVESQEPEDILEHAPRHRALDELERYVAAVAHDLRADLDQLLAQMVSDLCSIPIKYGNYRRRCARPRRRCRRQ